MRIRIFYYYWNFEEEKNREDWEKGKRRKKRRKEEKGEKEEGKGKKEGNSSKKEGRYILVFSLFNIGPCDSQKSSQKQGSI